MSFDPTPLLDMSTPKRASYDTLVDGTDWA